MKNIKCIIILLIASLFIFVGCDKAETVEKDTSMPVLNSVAGNKLYMTHDIEGFKFTSEYNTGKYDLKNWRITDSKMLNMKSALNNVPDGTEILIDNVHIDLSLKATDPQLDGLTQDSMDDKYHGTHQDGILITQKYAYQNIFAIEGFSKDIIDGWMFACGEYGSGEISTKRLTEKNLIEAGVYGNKLQIVYDISIKNKGEDKYHTLSVIDEFLIPAKKLPEPQK